LIKSRALNITTVLSDDERDIFVCPSHVPAGVSSKALLSSLELILVLQQISCHELDRIRRPEI